MDIDKKKLMVELELLRLIQDLDTYNKRGDKGMVKYTIDLIKSYLSVNDVDPEVVNFIHKKIKEYFK